MLTQRTDIRSRRHFDAVEGTQTGLDKFRPGRLETDVRRQVTAGPDQRGTVRIECCRPGRGIGDRCQRWCSVIRASVLPVSDDGILAKVGRRPVAFRLRRSGGVAMTDVERRRERAIARAERSEARELAHQDRWANEIYALRENLEQLKGEHARRLAAEGQVLRLQQELQVLRAERVRG